MTRRQTQHERIRRAAWSAADSFNHRRGQLSDDDMGLLVHHVHCAIVSFMRAERARWRRERSR
jgi:hypothetical protein